MLTRNSIQVDCELKTRIKLLYFGSARREQKIRASCGQKESQLWWCTSTIPALWKARGSQLLTFLVRSSQKKQVRKRGMDGRGGEMKASATHLQVTGADSRR